MNLATGPQAPHSGALKHGPCVTATVSGPLRYAAASGSNVCLSVVVIER